MATTTRPKEVVTEKKENALGYLSKLEDSMVMDIFYRLDVKDLLVAQGVSSGFYIMLNDDRLWKDVFLREIKGQKRNLKYIKTGWKTTALNYLYCYNEDGTENPKRSIDTFPFRILNFPQFPSLEIYTRWLRRHTLVKDYYNVAESNFVERRDVSELSLQEFIDRYEKPTLPVIFTGVQKDWVSMKGEWSKERLAERFGDITFKITHQSHKRIPMKFRDYAQYMSDQNDEEPLYVFDEAFGEKAPAMVDEYKIPPYFPEDLFEVSGKDRPHYRWIVIGPPRSGAPWHIDPAGTSAWNSLLSGKKRWLMYPPQFMPVGVALEDISEKFYGSPPSLLWLLEVYPYLPPDQKPIECVQLPGETIFIPGGWWHMVLNLEESIAVTQNFCDSQNFSNVCQELYGEEKEYVNFKKSLLEARPKYQPLFDEFELVASQVKHGFDNLEYWAPMVKEVFHRHFPQQSLEDKDFEISPPISGQSPVFIVNQQYVVKFYSTEFGGEQAYKNEVHLYSVIKPNNLLSSTFPKLLANGYYADGVNKQLCQEIKWKWPYLITTFVKGVNLQEVQIVPLAMDYPYPPPPEEEDDEDEEEEVPPDVNEKALIQLTSGVLSSLHSLEVVLDDTNPFVKDGNDLWSSWRAKVQELKTKYIGSHWNWSGMPIHLRGQMESYLPKNLEDVIDKTLPPCYIHTDLTDENILGEITHPPAKLTKKEQQAKQAKSFLKKVQKKINFVRKSPHPSGLWTPEHMIDFGDSNFGDRWYELISLHLSVFAGDKDRFREFLNSYKFTQRDGKLYEGKSWLNVYQADPAAFIYRAMCYTIIHHCDAMTTITRHYPEYRYAKSLEELAKLLWDLDYHEIPQEPTKQ